MTPAPCRLWTSQSFLTRALRAAAQAEHAEAEQTQAKRSSSEGLQRERARLKRTLLTQAIRRYSARNELRASPKMTQSMKSLRPVSNRVQEADRMSVRGGLRHSQSMSLRLPSIGGGGQFGKPLHSKTNSGAFPPRVQVLPALDVAAEVQGTENADPTNTSQ